MNTFLIVLTAVLIVLVSIAFHVRSKNMEKSRKDITDVYRELNNLEADIEAKIEKLEKEAIQEEYDELKTKVGKLVRSKKGRIRQFKHINS